MVPSLTQFDVLAAVRSFLISVVPPDVEVVQSQINRVSEPEGDDFVLMTPNGQIRLGTNSVVPSDVAFTASLAGNVMTVTEVLLGPIVLGDRLLGQGLLENPVIVSQDSGTVGGVGVYRLSAPQNASAPQLLASGVVLTTQPTQFSIQLDVHGPNSADNSQAISTLLRDSYATTFLNGTGVSPLYSDDPRQLPFFNAENQYENRWVVGAMFQVDPTIRVPQQFADSASVVLRSVDADFPPP